MMWLTSCLLLYLACLMPSCFGRGNGRSRQWDDPEYRGLINVTGAHSFIRRGPDFLRSVSSERSREFSSSELSQLFRSAGCNSDEIRLICSSPSETIAIENASFYSTLPNSEDEINCRSGPVGPLQQGLRATAWPFLWRPNHIDPMRVRFYPHISGSLRLSYDLRRALNRRCSGLGKGYDCTFNLGLDVEESATWDIGLVDIYFRCISDAIMVKECDRVTIKTFDDGRSQFLMSPIYPKYYLGGRTCRWILKAAQGQRIQLRFLDISLRERMSATDPECIDSVSVSERGKTLMRMCGESNEDINIISQGNTLEVTMESRYSSVFPRRGILAEFWPLGCATPVLEPEGGYLQHRNDTHAFYSCTLGHLFLPELERIRVLECSNHAWNQDVGNCFPYDFIRKYTNESVVARLDAMLGMTQLHATSVQSRRGDELNGPTHPPDSSLFSEVFAPLLITLSIIVIILFAFILLLLFKRHLQFEPDIQDLDEDRRSLTPASLRRHSPIVQLEITSQEFHERFHQQLQQLHQQQLQLQQLRQNDDLFLC